MQMRTLSPSHKIVLWAALTCGIALLLYGRPYIGSDGGSYFALTDSIVDDHDLDLSNQRYLIHVIGYAVQYNPVVDRFISPYTIGTSVFMTPFVWAGSRLNDLTHLFAGYEQYYHIPFLKGMGVLLASVFYSFLTLLMMWYIARKYFGGNRYFEVITVFVSVPLFYYTFVEPSYPHAISTFLTVLLWWCFVFRDRLVWRKYNISFLLLGLAAGALILVRNVNVALLLPYGLYVLWQWYRKQVPMRDVISAVVQMGIGLLPFFLASLAYNTYFFGSPFQTGYFGVGVLDSTPHYFFNYYLDPVRGMFFWAPITILSLAGLWHLRTRPEAFFITLASLLSMGIMLGFYNKWWAGLCFGQRYMTDLYPFFVIGLVSFLDGHRWKGWRVTALLCAVFSFLLAQVYLININSRAGNETLLQEHYTPLDLTEAALTAYRDEATPEEKNSVRFLYNRVFGGNSPTLIYGAQRLLSGEGPAIIQSADLVMTDPENFTITMQLYSFAREREVTVGVDLWQSPTHVHPDTHLFWFNSVPFVINQGTHAVTMQCTVRGACSFKEGDAVIAPGQYWVNPEAETLLARSRIYDVHAVQFDEGGVVNVQPLTLYYRSSKDRKQQSPIIICDTYPDSAGARCLFNQKRWQQTDSLYEALREDAFPSSLVATLPLRTIDPDSDHVTNVPITFRLHVKIDHNSSGNGLTLARWNRDGATTDFFPSEKAGPMPVATGGAGEKDRKIQVLDTAGTLKWVEFSLPVGDTSILSTDRTDTGAVALGIITYDDGDHVYIDDFDVITGSK